MPNPPTKTVAPTTLIDALIVQGAADLTIVSNTQATATPGWRRCWPRAGSTG
jgi:acyl CoA:acetate/3-ketoacid CoA transferase alpha subunit